MSKDASRISQYSSTCNQGLLPVGPLYTTRGYSTKFHDALITHLDRRRTLVLKQRLLCSKYSRFNGRNTEKKITAKQINMSCLFSKPRDEYLDLFCSPNAWVKRSRNHVVKISEKHI